jgi:hypothetical protein
MGEDCHSATDLFLPCFESLKGDFHAPWLTALRALIVER